MRRQRFKKPCGLIITAALLLGIIVTCIMQIDTQNFYLRTTKRDDQPPIDLKESISCHYMDSAYSVIPVVDDSFKPPARSIFFHETSCRGYLNSRQGCAVESAARNNPNWQVNVLFAGPISTNAASPGTILAALMKLPNVKVYSLHILSYVRGTPLHELVFRGALNRSNYKVAHTSDVLRYVSLYKYGGIYLDLDVIVVKPLGFLAWNFAAFEHGADLVGSCAMGFSRNPAGREVALAAVRDMPMNFKGYIWNHNGPGVITRVLRRRCNTTDVRRMTLKQCRGFQIYNAKYFYALAFSDGYRYFKPADINNDQVFIHHFWNKMTSHQKVQENSPYAKLAKKFCPDMNTLLNGHFGS